MSNDSRVVLPNLEIANQIQATGIALINVFAQDLFDFIDRGLQKTRGANWLTEMQIQNVGSDLNFKDPSILLKELSQKGQSPLREPIRSIVPQNHWKDFYKRLEELLGERHVWVHNAINADPTQLKSLVVLVSKISWALELPTVQECTKLLEHIDPEENSVAVEAPEPTSEPSELVSTVEKYMKDDISLVGSPVAGPFISHSYTLHLNGSIRDRSSDDLLEQYLEAAKDLGGLLIARKPNGGRLRITSDGVIAAYFSDSWGFLAKVSSDNWFPGHLG
jgi:hypothetical protein